MLCFVRSSYSLILEYITQVLKQSKLVLVLYRGAAWVLKVQPTSVGATDRAL